MSPLFSEMSLPLISSLQAWKLSAMPSPLSTISAPPLCAIFTSPLSSSSTIRWPLSETITRTFSPCESSVSAATEPV